MKGWEIVNRIKVKLLETSNVSRIANELGIDRKTVRKYRNMSMDEVAAYRKAAKMRTKKLDRYKKLIRKRLDAMIEDGVLNAQAIFEELTEHGYGGSERTVRRYVEKYREKLTKKRIYQPFETEPGFQAMVDLGESRKVWIGGKRVTRYFIGMVLSYSRRKYVEWYDRPVDTEMFLQFHQNAFRYFEGVPEEVVYDQTKLAVIKEQFGEVEFNEAFYRYAGWSGFRTYICRKYDPETKGKVESVVRYVKRNFLPGRRFDSDGDLCGQNEKWLRDVANAKIHETTCRAPSEAWDDERPLLSPFKEANYPSTKAFRRHQAHLDGLVKVLGNRYSVPASHHGCLVKVRATEDKVEIRSLEGEHLHTHNRCLDKGKRLFFKEHYRKEHKVSTEELTVQLEAAYGRSDLGIALQESFPRHYREQCKRLISLADMFSKTILQEAAKQVLNHGCASYKNLKAVAAYLSLQGLEEKCPACRVKPDIRFPDDIGLTPRELAYYDRFLEVRNGRSG